MSPRKTRAKARKQQARNSIIIPADSSQLESLSVTDAKRQILGEIAGNDGGLTPHDGQVLELSKTKVNEEQDELPAQPIEQLDPMTEASTTDFASNDTVMPPHNEQHLEEEQKHQEETHDACTTETDGVGVTQVDKGIVDEIREEDKHANAPNTSVVETDLHSTLHKHEQQVEPLAVAVEWDDAQDGIGSITSYDGVQDTIGKQISAKEDVPQQESQLHQPQPSRLSDFEHSEAIQKLEALFEPAPVDENGLDESSLAEILARATPAAQSPRESLANTAESNVAAVSDGETVEPAIDDMFHSVALPASKPQTPPKMVRTPSSTKARMPSVAAKRPSLLHKAVVTTRRSSVQASRVSIVPIPSAPNDSESRPKKQRSAIAALHTPPKPVKSTRPVTKSNFQLPGDAISAKLKALREERLLKEEEEAKKRREFRARPPPSMQKHSEMKSTRPSRARMSMQSQGSSNVLPSDQQRRASNAAARRVSAAASQPLTQGAQRVCSVANKSKAAVAPVPAVAVARQIVEGQGDAASDILPIAQLKQSHTQRIVSGSSTSRRMTSANSAKPAVASAPRPTTAMSGQRGKEVVNREKLELEQRDKTTRDKAEAIRKARAEAAEKSRLASKEWAERQKARKNAGGSRVVSGSGMNEKKTAMPVMEGVVSAEVGESSELPA